MSADTGIYWSWDKQVFSNTTTRFTASACSRERSIRSSNKCTQSGCPPESRARLKVATEGKSRPVGQKCPASARFEGVTCKFELPPPFRPCMLQRTLLTVRLLQVAFQS